MIENKEEFYKLLYRLRGLNNEGKLSKHLQAKLEAFEEMKELIRLIIPVVNRSNAIDYAEGFELAMDFIDKHPADPDITNEQVTAWIKLQDFLNKSDCKK